MSNTRTDSTLLSFPLHFSTLESPVSVTLPAVSISFFYQKIVDREPAVEIIIIRDKVSEAKEDKLSPLVNTETLGPMSPGYCSMPHVEPAKDRYAFLLQKGIELDDVHDQIRASVSVTFIELHRAFTDKDNRVFFQKNDLKKMLANSKAGFTGDYYEREWFKNSARCRHNSAGGGGDVVGLPSSLLRTHSDCMIAVLESESEMYKLANE